jgi:3-isopropylmalate/(R)-2-methylmalate dehydratase small subunit
LVIVARSFARIFHQNAVNLGLVVATCPGVHASRGDELAIGSESLYNRTSGERFAIHPLAPTKQDVMEAGGLIHYTRRRLVERRDEWI